MFSDGCHNIYMDSWIKWVKWMIDWFLSQICLCISNLPVMYIYILEIFKNTHLFQESLNCSSVGLLVFLVLQKDATVLTNTTQSEHSCGKAQPTCLGSDTDMGLNLFSRNFCWFKEVPFHLSLNLRLYAFFLLVFFSNVFRKSTRFRTSKKNVYDFFFDHAWAKIIWPSQQITAIHWAFFHRSQRFLPQRRR